MNKVHILVATLGIVAGQADRAIVTFEVADGYHVQANPVPLDYLIPTRLEIEASASITVGQPVYPAGQPYALHGSPDTLSVYDGTMRIALPISTAATAPPGAYTLAGALHYQLCDDRTCFRPTSKPLTLPIHIQDPNHP